MVLEMTDLGNLDNIIPKFRPDIKRENALRPSMCHKTTHKNHYNNIIHVAAIFYLPPQEAPGLIPRICEVSVISAYSTC